MFVRIKFLESKVTDELRWSELLSTNDSRFMLWIHNDKPEPKLESIF